VVHERKESFDSIKRNKRRNNFFPAQNNRKIIEGFRVEGGEARLFENIEKGTIEKMAGTHIFEHFTKIGCPDVIEDLWAL
jgi:hypothetical protein